MQISSIHDKQKNVSLLLNRYLSMPQVKQYNNPQQIQIMRSLAENAFSTQHGLHLPKITGNFNITSTSLDHLQQNAQAIFDVVFKTPEELIFLWSEGNQTANTCLLRTMINATELISDEKLRQFFDIFGIEATRGWFFLNNKPTPLNLLLCEQRRCKSGKCS